MSKHFKRMLALLLALVMVIGLLPTIALAADEPADVWSQILDYEATHIKKNRSTGKVSADDYAAIAGDVAEIVVNSDDYKPGTCTYDPDSGNAVFFWEDANGEPQGYSPALRAKIENGSNGTDLDSIGETVTKSFAKKGGAPNSNNVYVIGPWYGSDESFTDQYKTEGQHVASALGTTYTLYSGNNATIANVANAMSNGGVVFFDSHGDTDYYSNTDENDFVTRANTSYLTLTTGTGLTTTDKTRVQGTYAKYYPAYSFTSTDGDTVWCVNGDVIARHMNSNAPHSLLWMAICLGMATDGLQKPLRNKGVEVAYGYSQSVSFGGDYLWEETFWNNMVSGKTVAQSISAMKTAYGEWDYSKKICNANHWSNSWIANTITDARNDYCAFPIVVSSEDTYPGHGNVDALQTVNSTYTLFSQEDPDPCTITLKAGTTTWRTVNTYTNTSATLPVYTGTVPTGYTFAGWTASAISGTTQSAPTLYNGSYTTGSSTAVTLYACFSKSESSGGSSTGYRLMTSAPVAGDQIIIAGKNGSSYYAFKTDASTTGVAITVSNNLVTSDPTGLVWEVDSGNYGSTSGLTLSTSGYYLHINSSALKVVNNDKNNGIFSFTSAGNNAYSVDGLVNSKYLGFSGTSFSASGSATGLFLFKYGTGSSSTTTYTTTLTVCSHTYQETDRLDATCTEEGTIEYTCSKCGDTYYNDIPALGHNYGAWTSNNNGKHSKTCRRAGCGDVVTENCSYTSTTSGATTTFTCSVCNYSYSTTLDTYTVSYNVLGSVVNTASCVESQSVNLPATATAVDGFTFAGWVKNAIGTETATAPAILTGSYKPTADVTLYALYTRIEAGTGYYLATSVPKVGDEIIIALKSGDKYYALPNAKLGSAVTSLAGTELTVSGNKATATSSNTFNVYEDANGNVGLQSTANDTAFLAFNSGKLHCNGWGDTKYCSFSAEGNGLFLITAVSNDRALGVSGTGFTCTSSRSSGSPVYIFVKSEGGSGDTTYYTTAPIYVAPCEHTNTHVVNAADATCTAAGYTGDTYCVDCGSTIATGTAIAALGHNYGAFTSNNNGTHSKTCSRCSDKITEDCSFTTSTSGTTETHTCSVCNYSYTSELNTFEVTYSVPAGVSAIAKATVIEGESVTLPTAGTVDGFTFAGWVKNAIGTETATAPAILTGSYKPTADVTLYALYTRTEADSGSGATGYYLATETPAIGDKIIIAIKDGNDWYCLPNGNTSGVYSITADELTVTNGRAVNTEDNTFVVAENKGYTGIESTTGEYWLALNSGKLAMNGWGDTKPLAFTAGTESGTYYIIGAKSGSSGNEGRALDYSGSVFSCDGENGGSPVYIFVKSEGGSGDTTYYTTAPVAETPCTHENTTLTGAVAATCETAGYTGDYVCDDCGTTVTTGTAIAALGHDLVAGAIIIPTCTTAGYTEYNCSRCDYSENKDEVEALGHDLAWDGVVGDGTSHGLTCARCDYTESEACTIVGGSCSVCGYTEAAEVVVKINSAALRLGENIDLIYTASVPEDATNVYMTFTMNGETVTVEDDGTHIFAFTAINPQCMGDNVAAILYATVSGTEYTDEIATYSVRQYCINKLADSSVTGTLRTLISDVLAYGAAAQTYMNYNTSALVNSGSDVKNPTYSTFNSLSGLNATFTGTAAESPCWIGASLDLSNNVAMVFRFASPNKTGLSVKVTYNGKTTTFSGTSITAVSGMSGVYEVKLTGIKATDFDETVSASFYKSSAQVGNMVSYSVNTYICAKQADNDANLAALVKALYNYGTSAKAYRPA